MPAYALDKPVPHLYNDQVLDLTSRDGERLAVRWVNNIPFKGSIRWMFLPWMTKVSLD